MTVGPSGPLDGGAAQSIDRDTHGAMTNQVGAGAEIHDAGRALGPWATALRIIVRDKAAMAGLAVLAAIIVLCLLAPFYATHISHTDPFSPNLDGSTMVAGQSVPIMQPSTVGLGFGFTPIGPTWQLGPYLLGADNMGRDVAARLLYGGQNSLLIATFSTLICLVLAALIGVIAGFMGGIIDTILSRCLDIVWAFPIFLLAISLSIALINEGFTIGPFTITGASLAMPIIIIGIVFVPYVARPIRGQVLALKERDYVLASVALGVPTYRILWRDILPNIMTTLIVFAPLMMARNMIIESGLSFLSIGVQPPDASWGTIIQDGQSLLYTSPMVAIAPGIAISLTVLALNMFGDGLRDALDPRSKLTVKPS